MSDQRSTPPLVEVDPIRQSLIDCLGLLGRITEGAHVDPEERRKVIAVGWGWLEVERLNTERDGRGGAPDPVNHPAHYTEHPSGVECITVVEHMGFCVGNAIKYLWRAGRKGPVLEDLKKARWYVDREIQRLEVDHG